MTTVYGSTVLEHFRRPRNRRTLPNATMAREAYNALCGDRVRVEVAVRGMVLEDAAFTANACAVCTASASLLTERVRGLSVAAAAAISDGDVIAALDATLPPARETCAVLPARALRDALAALSPA